MQKLLKGIKSDVQTLIYEGEDPQKVYGHVCEKYGGNERNRHFLQKIVAKRVKYTVIPENRKGFSFSYHLYLIALWTAFLVTIISRQHRIEALGITSLSSVSLWGGFIVINLFAWIYLYLAVRSLNFNLSGSYQALFIASVDAIRLLVLFPVYWTETPFFSIFRLIPPFLVIIFGSFYILNCSNPFFIDKSGNIVFYRIKKKFHLGQKHSN